MNWPSTSSPSRHITPYTIFDLKKGAIYSKHSFYQLVKIYHPDRQGLGQNHQIKNISPNEGLERYRLIVLAHEILSDPVKRRAYDIDGAGWITRHGPCDRHTQGYYSEKSGKPYGRGEGYDESPFANATWEDWERWHARDGDGKSKHQYTGKYMDHNAFAALVIAAAVIAGVAQATSTGRSPDSVEERVRAFTAETREFLNNRAEVQKTDTSDSTDRVKWFLKKRDPSQAGLHDSEQDVYQGHFPTDMLPPAKGQEPSDPAG